MVETMEIFLSSLLGHMGKSFSRAAAFRLFDQDPFTLLKITEDTKGPLSRFSRSECKTEKFSKYLLFNDSNPITC